MKVTKQQLSRIIKEELSNVLSEKDVARMGTLNSMMEAISDLSARVAALEAKHGDEEPDWHGAPGVKTPGQGVTELPDMGRVEDW